MSILNKQIIQIISFMIAVVKMKILIIKGILLMKIKKLIQD